MSNFKSFGLSIFAIVIIIAVLKSLNVRIPNDHVQSVVAICMFGFAFAAAGAAKDANIGVTAYLMTKLIETYHTDEFSRSLRRLREWKIDPNFSIKFAKLKADSNNEKRDYPQIYYDWRHVKDYFVTCWRYKNLGIFTDEHIKTMMTEEQAADYLQIIEPMGKAADANYLCKPGKMLRNIFPSLH